MPMQHHRTASPNNPPASGSLAEGQISFGMGDAGDSPRAWVGVPTTVNPTGLREIKPDAPSDGAMYARRNSAWETVPVPVPPPDVSVVPIGGRLDIVGASPSSQISFHPFRGGWVRINGEDYPIPANGVIGTANNAYINGVAGQTLATETVYRVYVFVDGGGNLQLDFSTTGHETSATPGNVGTEIKVGDDTRSLVGIVQPDGPPMLFYDSVNLRMTRSWFNRPNANGAPLPVAFSIPMPVGNVLTLATNQACWFVSFFDETVQIIAPGSASSNIASASWFLYGQMDGGGGGIQQLFGNARTDSFTVGGFYAVGEGLHAVTLAGSSSAVNTLSGTIFLSYVVFAQ